MCERICTVIVVTVKQMIDTGQPEANDTSKRTQCDLYTEPNQLFYHFTNCIILGKHKNVSKNW